VQVKRDRPDGWKLRNWNVYAGTKAVVSQIFQPMDGPYTYLVMFEEGPLQGESRWFKEHELEEVHEDALVK